MAESKDEKEIDLLELARKLWDNKKFIIKVTLIGAVVGIVIAFSIPKEYKSTVVFTTNSNDAKTGNMGALASLAGINLSNMGEYEVFPPELYPEVLNSTPFIQRLLDINVRDENQETDTTLYAYLKNDQKRAWWRYILEMPKLLLDFFKPRDNTIDEFDKNSNLISDEKMKIIELLKSLFSVELENKTGLISINARAQSPCISALLADSITSYLQQYIIEERTRKAKMNLENSEILYEQSKSSYYDLQDKLASFIDKNQNISSAKYRIRQSKLENETNLAFSLYTQMAQQVQMNKIKVQDITPVFTIIQPAIEPSYPESPKKKIIVIASVFFSFIGAFGWILGVDFSQKIRKQI